MRTRKIRKLYEQSTSFNPRHLLGHGDAEAEWTVRILSGPFPDLKILSHRKRFWLEGKTVRGCNVILTDKKWGHFTVRRGQDFERCARFDYDLKKNRTILWGGLDWRILDEVRQTDYANLLVGKYSVLFAGKWRRLGYFTLRRRGDRRRSKL